MGEQEKKKRIRTEQDMSWKMYQIPTITAYCKSGSEQSAISAFTVRNYRPYSAGYACWWSHPFQVLPDWLRKRCANTGGLDHINTCMVWISFICGYCYGDASIVYLILGLLDRFIFFREMWWSFLLRLHCRNVLGDQVMSSWKSGSPQREKYDAAGK